MRARAAGFQALGELLFFSSHPTALVLKQKHDWEEAYVAYLEVELATANSDDSVLRFYLREDVPPQVRDGHKRVQTPFEWMPRSLDEFFSIFGGTSFRFPGYCLIPCRSSVPRLADFVVHHDERYPWLWAWENSPVLFFGDDGDLLLAGDHGQVSWFQYESSKLLPFSTTIEAATEKFVSWIRGSDSLDEWSSWVVNGR